MKIKLSRKSCCGCIFLGTWGDWHCKVTDRRLKWPEEEKFEQPDWCPLVRDGKIIIEQAD